MFDNKEFAAAGTFIDENMQELCKEVFALATRQHTNTTCMGKLMLLFPISFCADPSNLLKVIDAIKLMAVKRIGYPPRA